MPQEVKWQNSLTVYILKWFFVVAFTPLVIFSVWTYKNSTDYLYENTSKELLYSAVSSVEFIENWFNYRKSDISSWSSEPSTLAFMQALEKGSSKTDISNYAKSTSYAKLITKYEKKFIKLSYEYDYLYDVYLIDKKGNILFKTLKEDDIFTNINDGKFSSTLFADSVRKTLTDKSIHFSDFEFYAPSRSKIFGFLTAPIVDDTGAILGVFATQLKPQTLNNKFKTINERKNSIRHYVLGGNDLKLRTSINTPQEVLIKQIQTQQAQQYHDEHIIKEHAHTSAEQTRSYKGPYGHEVLGYHHPMNIFGVKWVLISEVDKEEAFSLADSFVAKSLFLLLFILPLIIISVYMISRHLTRPIKILVSASEDIAKGKHRNTVHIHQESELGALATSFNHMIEELDNQEQRLKEHEIKREDILSELKEQKFALDAHCIVTITKTDGDIIYVNKKFEELSGYKSFELIGRNHRLLDSGKSTPEFWEKMYETITNEKTWHGEVRNVRKDGSTYWVNSTIVPLLDQKGDIFHYISIQTDITQAKEDAQNFLKQKEKAEAATQAKSEFLSSMSHEIRTPMNGVLGMLGLLKNTKLSVQQLHQLDVAESSAESLLSVINDILEFSKAEEGNLEIEEYEFNLNDDLESFSKYISIKTQQSDIEVIIDTKEIKHPMIISDPGRLRQILTHLLSNAIKFTSKGQILITCVLDTDDKNKRGKLSISVKDSGIGIAQKEIPALFDSFTQLDSSSTRNYEGTGLGLCLVKKLVELMGGSVNVKSVLGEGSTFSFDISVGLGEQNALLIPRVSIIGKRILIVDDNAVNREVLHAQLTNWGVEVTEAEDAGIALHILKEELLKGQCPPFDIALIDMHMPHMDGAELGKKIKNTPAYEDMKLVMMTSLDSRSDAYKFSDIGYNAFFSKPTSTRDLFNTMNILIDDADVLKHSDNFITKNKLNAMSDPATMNAWPKDTRVLVVEDNLSNQIVIKGILETLKIPVDLANDGQEAMFKLKQSIQTQAYTLVLMDCKMPIMDGYATTEAIRRGEAGSQNTGLPILALTANAMLGDREKCIACGMNDYLSKPINPNILKKALTKWLKHKASVPLEYDTFNEGLIWNKEAAIARLSGNEEILKKVIKLYLEDYAMQFTALQKALDEGVQEDIVFHSHTIKGASANIGAERLQKITDEMNEKAEEGEFSSLSNLLEDAKKEISELVELLKDYLSK